MLVVLCCCLSCAVYALSGCDQWPDSVGHGTFSSGRNATIRGRIWQNPKGGSGDVRRVMLCSAGLLHSGSCQAV